MELYIGILGTLVTVASFIFAIYSNQRYNKLESYNREESWEIYRQSSNVLSLVQGIEKLKINNSDLIRLSAQGERAAIELTVSSIKSIKRFAEKYDEETINLWNQNGRLVNDTHIKTFRSFL